MTGRAAVPVLFACALLLAVRATTADAQLATQTFLAYGSGEWRIAFFPTRLSTLPPEIVGAGYDDSSWDLGVTPVGYPDTHCSYVLHWYWDPAMATAVLRHRIVLPSGLSSLSVHLTTGAGTKTIFLNGQMIGGGTWSGGCPGPSLGVELRHGSKDAWHAGVNTLVLVGEGPGPRYLDGEVVGTIDPVAARRSSWGAVHSLYR